MGYASEKALIRLFAETQFAGKSIVVEPDEEPVAEDRLILTFERGDPAEYDLSGTFVRQASTLVVYGATRIQTGTETAEEAMDAIVDEFRLTNLSYNQAGDGFVRAKRGNMTLNFDYPSVSQAAIGDDAALYQWAVACPFAREETLPSR